MIKRPLKTPSTRNVVMIVHYNDKATLEILNAMSKKLTLKAIVDLCKPIKMQKLYNKSTKHYCLGFDNKYHDKIIALLEAKNIKVALF